MSGKEGSEGSRFVLICDIIIPMMGDLRENPGTKAFAQDLPEPLKMETTSGSRVIIEAETSNAPQDGRVRVKYWPFLTDSRFSGVVRADQHPGLVNSHGPGTPEWLSKSMRIRGVTLQGNGNVFTLTPERDTNISIRKIVEALLEQIASSIDTDQACLHADTAAIETLKATRGGTPTDPDTL